MSYLPLHRVTINYSTKIRLTMLLPIRLICSSKKVRKDGTSLLFIQYCQSAANKTLLNTEIAIPPKFWQKRYCRVSDDLPLVFGKASALNKELQRLLRLAEDIIAYAMDNNIQNPVLFVKKIFHPSFDLTKLKQTKIKLQDETNNINLDFFYQINEYINLKAKSVTPKMINVYKNMRDTLKAFEVSRGKLITFEGIDYNFYEDLWTTCKTGTSTEEEKK
jgi:hypothetical protein